jgi:signal transduction histidine kinase
MDLLGQSALVLAVTAFSLAVTTLSRNLRNKLGLAFSALCAVVWGWSFFFFLEKIFGAGTFYRFHLTFNLLLAPVALFFIRVFTRVDTTLSRVLMRGSLVYGLAVTGAVWSKWWNHNLPLNLAYWAPAFIALETAHLMYRDVLLRRGQFKGTNRPFTVGIQRRWLIFAGAFFILASCYMDHFPRLGDVLPSLGNVFLCIYLFFIGEAVSQQRLLNVTGLINRILVLVFLSLCLTVIYTLLVAWIQNAPGLFIMNTFLASFIILMLIDPIRKLANLGVMQLFYRQQLKMERVVDDYQMQLTGVLEPVGLAQLSLNLLEATLKVESASVFVLRSDGTKFRRIRGLRDEGLDTREILAAHPMAEFVLRLKRRGETPVLLDTYLDNEIDRSVTTLTRQNYEMILLGLKGLQANVLLPFIADQTVLGFVALKSNMPPEPWGANWGILSVIYPFFHQGARVLKNMDIYVRLREKDRLAALGEMSAGLAHEIRNPLAAIKGAAQLLGGNTKLATSPFTTVIVDEVNRLNKVVTQFLEYARSAPPEMVDFKAGTLIEKTLQLFLTTPTEGVRMAAVAPAGGLASLPAIRVSPEQIQQVLVNLIQNAVVAVINRRKKEKDEGKEPAPGLVEVGGRVEVNSRGRSELMIFVEDNGVGIARENIEKIFIPFYTTTPSGTGLGLPICSRIMEAHGGRIDVVAEEGRFARFTLYFPLETREAKGNP